jgi:hypothetical protein
MRHLTQPCSQCPFRRAAAPGWLGPWTPETFIEVILPYVVFPCHKTVHRDRIDDDPRLRVCAGAAIFLNNHLRLSQNVDMVTAQKALRGCTANVKASVFHGPAEFITHHTVIQEAANVRV